VPHLIFEERLTMTPTVDGDILIPDAVARAAVLPESYKDEKRITYPAFAWLRENNPLGQARLAGFDPIWLVTKYQDIREVERQPLLFPSGVENPILNDQKGDAFIRSMCGGSIRSIDLVTYMDPPEHTDIRGVATEWFMPRNIRKFEARIREQAKGHVQRLVGLDDEFDFVQDFALYYPLHVIMTLFGVPEKDEPLLLKLTQELFGVHEPGPEGAEAAPEPADAARQWTAAVAGFYAYFGEKIAERRANPTDDLMSLIATAKVRGEYLPDTFCGGWYIGVATAGHDTTSSSLAGAILGMAEHPGQWEKVKSDPSLIPALVEEAIRWTSPVKHFMRSAARDTELRGRQIKAGDRLMLHYPSANRDEEIFTNPDAFDIERTGGKSIAFGVGPHACIGMHVARLEMKILFEELLPLVESFEVTGTPTWVQTNFVGGMKSLPVRFTKV
jgi:alpha-terpineol hydroxylase